MENHGSENSNNSSSSRGHVVYDFEQYSLHQVMALDQLFNECDENPTEALTVGMISSHPVLSDLGYEKIKVWFENRRYLREQNQEGVMYQVVMEKLSDVLVLENQYLRSVVEHVEKEQEFIENIKQHIKSLYQLAAPEMPRHVLRNVKMNALRRLLMKENEFMQRELEQMRRETEYMERTKTPRCMLIREGRLDELMEIVSRLQNL